MQSSTLHLSVYYQPSDLLKAQVVVYAWRETKKGLQGIHCFLHRSGA